MNKRSLNIILHNININNIPNRNTSRISILNNKNTLRKAWVEILEVEENNQEEDLVKEEAKSYDIIVGIQDTLPDIVKILWKIIHIVKHLITL